MKLFQRPNANAASENPQSDYPDQKEPDPVRPPADTADRTRLMTMQSLLVLIVVVVALGIVLSHGGTKSANSPQKTPAKPGTNHKVNKTPAAPQSGAAADSAAQPAAPGSLSNTGPGDVIGLFAATSVAAAGLHYVITLRRLKSS